MASELEYVKFVCEQAEGAGEISFKKMFGEYLIYCDGKPSILVCDNTAFVKIVPETTEIVGAQCEQGYPYNGAKLHYILDIDDKETVFKVVLILAQITPLPKKKKPKKV